MPVRMNIDIILNLFTFILATITTFLCVLTLLMVVLYHRRSRSIPLLLACHTCVALLISSMILARMIFSSLSGFMGVNVAEFHAGGWCHWRGFLIYGFLCAIYDSYSLQAFYRLCRVVFYRQKRFHQFSLYVPLVFVESLFSMISMVPLFVGGFITYVPTEFYCQTPLSHMPATGYITVRLYLLPMLFIALVYIYLLRYIRRTNPLAADYRRRAKQIRRNLVIIRRLVSNWIVLMMLGLPSVVMTTVYLVTGQFVLMCYRVGWLSVSVSFVFLASMLIQWTRPLRKTARKLCRRRNFDECD